MYQRYRIIRKHNISIISIFIPITALYHDIHSLLIDDVHRLTLSTFSIHQIDVEQFTIGTETYSVCLQLFFTQRISKHFYDSALEVILGPKGRHLLIKQPSAILLSHWLIDHLRMLEYLGGYAAPEALDNITDPNYSGQWYLNTLDMTTLWEDS